jgi:hypothetical protein
VGIAGAALAFVPYAPFALAGAVIVIAVVPAAATAYALVGDEPTADAADFFAASFGGFATSSLALWVIGATVGLDRATILAAPLALSIVLAATCGGAAAGRPAPRELRALLALALGFAILVAIPFYPHGRQRADGIHHMGLSDWYLHLMMTTSLDTATSLPPPNPYLLAHAHAHYHYAFHLLGAAIHRASGRAVDIFPILLGLALWIAAAFPLVLFSMSRRRLDGDSRKALLAAAAGTLFAGFDLVVWASDMVRIAFENWPLPLSFKGLRLLVPSAHLHSWIPVYERQFNAPYVALLWAPHYVAAVTAAILSLHALRAEVGRPPRLAAALVLAALPGLSAYVLIAMAVGIAALVAADVWHHRGRVTESAAVARWIPIGVAALVLAAPVLLTLRASVEQHVAPLVLHISAVGSLRNGAVFTTLLGDHQWTRALDEPLLLAFQLGVIGVGGAIGIVRRVRSGRLDDLSRGHAAAAIAILVFLVLFRPPVGMDNNLGFRPMLLVWCLLVPFAAEAWFGAERFRRLGLVGAAICLAALPYGLVGATLEGWSFRPVPREQVEVARWINANLPPASPVALDPEDHSRYFDMFLRQPLIEAEHRRNAFMLGAPPDEFEAIRASLHEAFTSLDAKAAANRFEQLGAVVVVVRANENGALPWPRLPCYREAHRDADLVVLVRDPASCDGR